MGATIETIVRFALQIYTFIIFGYIIMSWIPQLQYSAIGEFLGRIVEPFLKPFRQVIPSIGILDISPIVALLTLYYAEEGLIYLIYLIF
ncbi:YggT family protein [Ammoniphilus resinae]|uniref:YggT family protein n=1 Tax=Ammoniphilus resinae TaxID=861532 RepID=A0ABS4GK90_9BACL|nr:YggT family protein [Ammoniphilus resinae]MBP1930675.1 YggT family protein [Ammoniphilus resinae]